MVDTSDPRYDEWALGWAEQVKQFEAEYGEDRESSMMEYSNVFVSLPFNVVKAAGEGNIRSVLQSLGKGNV